MTYQSFEDLEVWKKSLELAIKIYNVLDDCKDYGIKNQMTRAVVSIPSNIAEGCERDSKSETIRFLLIAKGSAAELRTQVYIAKEINLIVENTAEELISDLKKISAMLHNLINNFKS